MSWNKVKLSEVCEINVGKTPARNNPDNFGQGSNWASIADINGEVFLKKTKEQVSSAGINTANMKIVPQNTVLFSFKLSVGKICITGIPLYTNEAIAALPIKNKNELETKYLYYAMQAQDFSYLGERAAKGLTLNKEKLNRITIPLPPFTTQQKIAAILDKADELRKKGQQVLAKYDELLQSIFYEMFGDPVKNEKGWELERFEDVGSLDRGISKNRPRNAPELLGGPYPLIQTGDVANSEGYISNFKSTYSEAGLRQSKMWKAGTLCITIAANIAKTGILMFDACFPDSIVGFIPNNKTNVEFIQLWLSHLQEALEASAPESAQKNINLEILRNLILPVPPIELQNQFTIVTQNIQEQKQQIKQQMKQSENLFQILLQKAFKEELIN